MADPCISRHHNCVCVPRTVTVPPCTAFLPDLSRLTLRKDDPPVVVVPTATYVTPPPQSAPKPPPKPTLVAKLLQYRGSNVNAWGKGTAPFLSGPMQFLAVVRYLLRRVQRCLSSGVGATCTAHLQSKRQNVIGVEQRLCVSGRIKPATVTGQ